MKCCLRVRIVVLIVLLSSIGLWLSGGESRATEADQRSSRLLGRSAGNVFDSLPGAGADVSWATVFDYRRLGWSFAPKAAAIPMASINVTTTADTIDAAANCAAVTLASLPGPGGQTSLREAICAANNNLGADIINFSVNGTFALTGGANEDDGGTGDFDIKQSLTINGNGTANTILDGSGTERIFDVFPSAASTFDLSNLTLQNGDTRATSFKEGGAMYLHNNVTSTFSGIQVINNFSGANGAIENRGTLTINSSVISNNQTLPASGTVVGGGIRTAGTLTIDNTTISNNTVRGEGGGIATTTGAGVTVTITNSTISGNTASITGGGLGNGGGISTTGNQGTINLTNCTISGNRADVNGGGAAFASVNANAVTLTNVTIANNTADNDNNNSGAGGGFSQSTTTVTLRNTIVAGNFNSTAATRDDISGAVVAASSYNLIGDGTGSTGITNGNNSNQVGSGGSPINPLLGPLMNNGGPTETHALLTGSPAINTANNATAPATDQRGVARPGGAAADIGSYEVSDTTPPDTTITGNPTNPSNSTSATFTFTGSDNITPAGSLTFQCQLDGGGFSACTSPRTYTGLADGSHTFQVRAIDAAGNTDPTPASYTWTIDATPPNTSITANPTNPSASTSASFSFTGNDGSGTGIAGFQCQLDGGGFSTCTSPQPYTGLSQGSHTFQVRAIDGTGNVDPSPASFTWVIDTVVPDTTITANPTNPSASANASFSFTGSDPGGSGVAGFQCQIDGGGFSTCTSPRTYTSLSDGSHTFQVRAVDAAGNIDPTPASYTWTIVPLPTLGDYADTPLTLSGNATVAPVNNQAPTNTVYASATTSSAFKGKLEVDPATGVVRVTNAHPAGTYAVTVSAYNAGGTATKTFNLTVNTPAGCGYFGATSLTGTNFGVSTVPNSVAVGDFNGDGRQDLVTANNFPGINTVSVLLRNSANDGFDPKVDYPAGNRPQAVAVGDLNGDGRQDIIAGNRGGNISVLFRNVANNGFDAAVNLSVADTTNSLAVGDLNGDGKPDIAATISGTSTVSVFYRNSNNTGFDPRVDLTATSGPNGLTIADFNGDGRADLVVVSSNGTASLFYRNAGNTGFDPAVNITLPTNNAVPVAAGDFNGDGRQDFAVGYFFGNYVSVYLRKADNSDFDAPVNLTVNSTASIAVGDFNHDGRQDIATANFSSGLAYVLMRTPDNTGFQSPISFGVGSGPNSIAVGDFNGDNRQDLVTANQVSDNVTVLQRACDTTPPDTTITANPTNPSASANASFSFTGSDPVGSGVASFECQLDGGAFIACTSPQTYTGLSDGSHTFQVRAVDAAGNTDATPAGFTWLIDTTSPPAPIVNTPANGSSTNNTQPTVSGTAEPGSTVTVFIDGGGVGIPNADASGNWMLVPPTPLSNGAHTVRARATDAVGNTSVDSNTNTFIVDTVAPDTTITANPNNPSASANASLSFTGSDPGGSGAASFECKLDGGSFTACASPQTYTGLSDGSHTFQVRAVDMAGNVDGTPASFTWIIDTTPPPAPVVSTPANGSSTNNTQPTVTGTAEPLSTVTVFLDGNPAGTTNADTSGNWMFMPPIPLSDGSHTVRARAADAVGNTSVDSNTNTFIVDTVAPDTTITANPPNPSASANASFSFTGSDGSGSGVVGFECRLDGGSFIACTSPQTYTGLSDGSHTFQVRAIDAAGNIDPAAASFTWIIDTTGPDTTITANPTNPNGSANASFSFTGNDGSGTGVAGFECQLDGGGYSTCTSPQTYTGLADGSHTFQVRAVDVANNRDSTPASFTWVVDTIAPDTTITANPPNPSASANASFNFTGNDNAGSGVASFQCQLDGGGFSLCTSPQTYTGLADGSHTFQVRAIDAVGNADPTPASFTWTIDATPPDTIITGNPPNPSSSTNGSFSFTGSDSSGTGVAGFQCQLDGGGFSSCTSPQTYTGLSLGSHTFQVRAVDNVGNIDLTPASYAWSINSPPVITPASLSRAAGSTTANLTVANASDTEDAEDQLRVQISTDGTNFFDSVSAGNVTVTLADQNAGATGVNPTASGEVSAAIQTPCDSTVGPINLFLRVTDTAGQVDTKPWTLTITPNPSPVLSYGPTTVIAGTSPSFGPATGPSDNGTFGPVTLTGIAPAAGLTLAVNPTNGVVTVTSATLAGSYNVVISVTDNCSATTPASFTVNVVCPAITLLPASLPNAQINNAYPQTITASPAGGNYAFAVTSGLLPAGLTLNPNGSFSGAPTQSGTFNFRVTATGFAGPGGSCTAFRDYTLLVNCPSLTLSPASLSDGVLGDGYSQTVSAAPAGSYSYSVSSGALPPGLMLNAANGTISGTPTVAGSFSFRIAATAGACAAVRDYTVTITCNPVTLGALSNGVVGSSYNQTISVTPAAPAGSYNFSLQGGTLPNGLALNPATGVLSGVPGVAGTFSFTVRAQTAGGCSGVQTYSVVISCPAVTLSALTTPVLNSPYSQTVSATPAGGNYTFAVTSGELPAGLSLNSATGLLSGTPTAAGAYTFTITANSRGGFGNCSGSRQYTGTIGSGGCPTITLPSNLAGGIVGQLYNRSVAASPAGIYSYTSSGTLPPGVTLYGSFGLLYGYPTANGTYNFTVTATGANSCSASQSYSVVIGAGSSLAALNDFSGDQRSDFVLWRAAQRQWLIVDGATTAAQTVQWGQAGDKAVTGDYDGDGKADLAGFGKDGHWRMRLSSGGTLDKVWGLGSDVPVPGDYDGDGKTDLAVWRGTESGWYIQRSSDGQTETVQWGTSLAPSLDLPVPGDYDGDGKTDIAVFRQASGHWYIRRSSDAKTVDKAWGLGSDVPVPGDYDGDGLTDIAVWRGSEGDWHIVRSSDGAVESKFWGAGYEPYFDVPAVGDYDGDGKADVAVWRKSEGRWYVQQSSDGATRAVTQGQVGDKVVTTTPRP